MVLRQPLASVAHSFIELADSTVASCGKLSRRVFVDVGDLQAVTKRLFDTVMSYSIGWALSAHEQHSCVAVSAVAAFEPTQWG